MPSVCQCVWNGMMKERERDRAKKKRILCRQKLWRSLYKQWLNNLLHLYHRPKPFSSEYSLDKRQFGWKFWNLAKHARLASKQKMCLRLSSIIIQNNAHSNHFLYWFWMWESKPNQTEILAKYIEFQAKFCVRKWRQYQISASNRDLFIWSVSFFKTKSYHILFFFLFWII